jgi:hypothetical protein
MKVGLRDGISVRTGDRGDWGRACVAPEAVRRAECVREVSPETANSGQMVFTSLFGIKSGTQ